MADSGERLSGGWGRVRLVLFGATGLSVPFAAFPPARVLGRPLDLATVFAALFLIASAKALVGERPRKARIAFVAGAGAVPLLALLPPGPPLFASGEFLRSYAHWLLFVLFFAAAGTLAAGPRSRRTLAAVQVAVGVLVAAFGLYQVVGIPRQWPGTGPLLVPFQRGPFLLMPIDTYQRPTSVFLEPSWLGGYLAWIAVLAFCLWFVPTARNRRTSMLVLAMAVVLAVLLATLSWGSYVDLGVAAAGALVLAARRAPLRRRKTAIAILLAAVVVVALAITPLGRRVGAAAATRFTLLRETPIRSPKGEQVWTNSGWVRYHNAVHTIELWKIRPLFGIGLGQFHRYKDFAGGREIFAAESWCGWLGIAAEAGILGPAVLAAAVLLVLRRRRALPREDFASMAVPLLAALAVVQQSRTASYIDLWWWFPLSLAAALAARERDALARPVRRASMPALDAQR